MINLVPANTPINTRTTPPAIDPRQDSLSSAAPVRAGDADYGGDLQKGAAVR